MGSQGLFCLGTFFPPAGFAHGETSLLKLNSRSSMVSGVGYRSTLKSLVYANVTSAT